MINLLYNVNDIILYLSFESDSFIEVFNLPEVINLLNIINQIPIG